MIESMPTTPERKISTNISSITILDKGERAPTLSEEKIAKLISDYFRKRDPESGQSHWLRILRKILAAKGILPQLQSQRAGALEHGPGELSAEEINVKNSRLAQGVLYFRIRGGIVIPEEISARPEDVTLDPTDILVEVKLDPERLADWLERLAQQKSLNG